ncbi:MAG: glycerophosphoryl diester phosphodiesterase membrane domain-containing protein [Thermoleophilia bacterium]
MTPPGDGTRPRLRPLSLGEILDVAIKICLAHWRTLIKAVLVVVVPVQIVGTIVNADYTVDSFEFGAGSSQTPEETLEQFNQYLGGLAIAGVLQGLAVLLATAACLRAIAQAYLGEETDWRSSLRYALRLAPSLLLLTLLYGLGLIVGFLLLILPGIWLYVAWAFATPALLVEGLRGRKALGRSFALVKGRWWRTCGVLVVGFLLAAIVSTVVQAVFVVGILVGEDNDALVLVLSAIAGIVGLAVSTPFQAALLTVLYFDLRVRKEGFDLELLADEIGGTVQPDAAAAGARAAPATVLPPAEAVDRTGAPYWPPPPGWQPQPPPTPPDGAQSDEPRAHEPSRALWPPPEPRSREERGSRDEPRSPDDPPDEPPRTPGAPHG